jgi:hypothetical protein
MDLGAIRSEHSGPGTENLTRSLACVLRSAGAQPNDDDLNAALGLPWMTVAVPREPCVARWPAYARDFKLVKAARLFGLRIRDLHPPDAATGLDRAPEYFQHFDASYRPLIQRALEHGQAVLAWQGWPSPHEMDWGIVTATSADGVGFRGVTPLGSLQGVTVMTPPIQMYVVEDITPVQPDSAAIVWIALEAADQVLGDRLDPRLGVATGPAAYEVWAERIRGGGRCPYAGSCLPNCHGTLLKHLLHNRAVAHDFVQAHRSVLDAFAPGSADALLASAIPAMPHATREAFLSMISNLQSEEIRTRDLIAGILLRFGRIPQMSLSAASASQRPSA